MDLGVRLPVSVELFDCPDLNPWRAMEKLTQRRRYASGEFLFHEGSPCRGVYLVKSGQVQLLMRVQPKEYQAIDLTGEGAHLGLNEVMGGMSHKFGAQAIGPVEVDFIERMKLMRFLRKHHDVCIEIVGLLSENLHGLYQRLRSMARAEARRKRKVLSTRVH